MSARYAALVADLLAHADIRIDGPRPWDVTVRDPRFYKRALAGGAIGLGESFMDGWWDTPALDQAIARMLGADLRAKLKLSPFMLIDAIAEHLPNLPYVWPGLRPFLSRFKTYQATAETHYEVGNDFYRMLLGPHMIYSCTYWEGATTLDQSEDLKLEMSCRKLALAPGQRLLEIGCGWGGFAKYAAENYGVSVVGVTISAEQRDLAVERCRGLPVEIRLATATYLELLQGARSQEEQRRLKRFVQGYAVLSLGPVASSKAVELVLRHGLAEGLEPLQALTAATALAHEIPLVTRAPAYRKIEGLEIIQPY